MESLARLENLTEKERKAIEELVEGLKQVYGEDLSRIILYGSKARGDSTTESDIDILVVLKEMGLGYDEIKKINEVAAPICLKYDLLISALPIEEKRVSDTYKTIFVYNVLKEGTPII